jgi:hypothetical protein
MAACPGGPSALTRLSPAAGPALVGLARHGRVGQLLPRAENCPVPQRGQPAARPLRSAAAGPAARSAWPSRSGVRASYPPTGRGVIGPDASHPQGCHAETRWTVPICSA